MRLTPLRLQVAPMSATHPNAAIHRGCGAGLHVDAGPDLPFAPLTWAIAACSLSDRGMAYISARDVAHSRDSIG